MDQSSSGRPPNGQQSVYFSGRHMSGIPQMTDNSMSMQQNPSPSTNIYPSTSLYPSTNAYLAANSIAVTRPSGIPGASTNWQPTPTYYNNDNGQTNTGPSTNNWQTTGDLYRYDNGEWVTYTTFPVQGNQESKPPIIYYGFNNCYQDCSGQTPMGPISTAAPFASVAPSPPPPSPLPVPQQIDDCCAQRLYLPELTRATGAQRFSSSCGNRTTANQTVFNQQSQAFNQGPAFSVAAPFNQGQSFSQAAPFNQGQSFSQAAPFNQGQSFSQAAPFNQGQSFSQAAPFNQGQSFSQGAPFNQGPAFSQAVPFNQDPVGIQLPQASFAQSGFGEPSFTVGRPTGYYSQSRSSKPNFSRSSGQPQAPGTAYGSASGISMNSDRSGQQVAEASYHSTHLSPQGQNATYYVKGAASSTSTLQFPVPGSSGYALKSVGSRSQIQAGSMSQAMSMRRSFPPTSQVTFPSTGQVPFQSTGQVTFPSTGQIPFQSTGQVPFPPTGQVPFPPTGQAVYFLQCIPSGMPQMIGNSVPMQQIVNPVNLFPQENTRLSTNPFTPDNTLPSPNTCTTPNCCPWSPVCNGEQVTNACMQLQNKCPWTIPGQISNLRCCNRATENPICMPNQGNPESRPRVFFNYSGLDNCSKENTDASGQNPRPSAAPTPYAGPDPCATANSIAAPSPYAAPSPFAAPISYAAPKSCAPSGPCAAPSPFAPPRPSAVQRPYAAASPYAAPISCVATTPYAAPSPYPATSPCCAPNPCDAPRQYVSLQQKNYCLNYPPSAWIRQRRNFSICITSATHILLGDADMGHGNEFHSEESLQEI